MHEFQSNGKAQACVHDAISFPVRPLDSPQGRARAGAQGCCYLILTCAPVFDFELAPERGRRTTHVRLGPDGRPRGARVSLLSRSSRGKSGGWFTYLSQLPFSFVKFPP